MKEVEAMGVDVGSVLLERVQPGLLFAPIEPGVPIGGELLQIRHQRPHFLGDCDQYQPTARTVTMGTTPGYTDRYPAFFHGQQLDITGLKTGRYWLVHIANEDFHLRELRYDDNAASVLIQLTWSGGTPHVSTLRTCLKTRC